MYKSSYYTMHEHAGIDWTKAARLAMGVNQATQADMFDNQSEWSSIHLESQVEPSSVAIKYPLNAGKHLNRVPERDSFLRGGTQFKTLDRGFKSG